MALSGNRLLFFLYFVQGMPYGLQVYYIPVYFHSVLRMSASSITLTHLLSFPWLLKFMLGPVVDSFKTKRFWLIYANLMLVCVCFFGVLAKYQSLMVQLSILFIINVLASIQDIIVDAVAVSILPFNEMAKAGATQVVAYKIGAVFAGSISSLFMDYIDWSSFLMLIGCFFSLAVWQSATSNELLVLEGIENSAHDVQDSASEHKFSVIKGVFSAFKEPQILWTILLLIVYKLGEQGTLNVVPLYLLNKGVPKSHISTWLTLVGGSLSITGSVLGGFGLHYSYLSTKDWLLVIFNVRLLPSCITLLIAIANRDTNTDEYSAFFEVGLILGYLVLCLVGGMITTNTYTAMMQLTKLQPIHLQATYLSVFSTTEVLGKLVFLSFSGSLTDMFGYTKVYLLFITIDLLSIFIVKRL